MTTKRQEDDYSKVLSEAISYFKLNSSFLSTKMIKDNIIRYKKKLHARGNKELLEKDITDFLKRFIKTHFTQ